MIFSFRRPRHCSRFKTEARGNSEMAQIFPPAALQAGDTIDLCVSECYFSKFYYLCFKLVYLTLQTQLSLSRTSVIITCLSG